MDVLKKEVRSSAHLGGFLRLLGRHLHLQPAACELPVDAESADLVLGCQLHQIDAGAVTGVESHCQQLTVDQRLQTALQFSPGQQCLLDQRGPRQVVRVGAVELQEDSCREVGHVGHVGAVEAETFDVRCGVGVRPR